jgi:hypothetical protein
MSKVMTLSKYSIINLTNYLETTIKKMDTSDNEFLYIESYIDSDGIRRVKLKTDSGISSVTTTYNKEKGDVLESCVKVNLYAFYKVIKYADDLINLEIYDDKLIVSSYYSEYDEYDQLEVELTISEKYSYTETGISMPVDVKTFTLSVLQRHYISSHLDITEDIENLNISRKSGVLYFTTYKNGVSTTLRVKDIEVDTELDDFSFDIHSYFIRLVFTSGAFTDVKFYISNNELIFSMGDYDCKLPISLGVDEYSIPEDMDDDSYNKYMVVEGDTWISFSTLITRLSMGLDNAYVTISYVDDHHCDYVLSSPGYNVSMRNQAAMLSKDSVTYDARLLHALTKDFNVDAFSVYTKGDELLIKIEDGAVVKFITYNHSEYIKDAPKTWKVF